MRAQRTWDPVVHLHQETWTHSPVTNDTTLVTLKLNSRTEFCITKRLCTTLTNFKASIFKLQGSDHKVLSHKLLRRMWIKYHCNNFMLTLPILLKTFSTVHQLLNAERNLGILISDMSTFECCSK